MVDKPHKDQVDLDDERRISNEGGHASDEKGADHEFNDRDAAEDAPRSRKTRGGTHDQHVHAGKKGGSRIRELIELGYKYEQEHGIGPGRTERSKLAAQRRTTKSPDETSPAAGE